MYRWKIQQLLLHPLPRLAPQVEELLGMLPRYPYLWSDIQEYNKLICNL
uniref:ORF48a n=1 Tax=Pinus koraiensis TaxID=88728 RepID=A4QMJ7_PINKO|nr:ORF48a [Pinus koraiensis]